MNDDLVPPASLYQGAWINAIEHLAEWLRVSIGRQGKLLGSEPILEPHVNACSENGLELLTSLVIPIGICFSYCV